MVQRVARYGEHSASREMLAADHGARTWGNDAGKAERDGGEETKSFGDGGVETARYVQSVCNTLRLGKMGKWMVG